MISAFLNTIMQEMLVRGYLYQMIKSKYNIVAAVIVSTGLFTFAHGGAFEAGILPVLNVITMSLFMTAVLEYTDSLIAPIIIHFYGMVLVQLFWVECLWQKIIHICSI